MPPQPKKWLLSPRAPAEQLARYPELDPIIVQLLYSRGITDPEAVDQFLACQAGESAPFALAGMEDAAARIRQAVAGDEQILVYGDFDVDGVTATALCLQTLRALGAHAAAHIPHRTEEGYGLNKDTLAQLAADGASLILTVDCGVRSLEEIDYANRLGLDVVVTDHHSVGEALPPAAAVVDPKRPDNPEAVDELAGVGVAYKLAQALLEREREDPVAAGPVGLELHQLLDLVALGTVADLVPLVGENRVLVRQGLDVLNRTERPGIPALCESAGITTGQIDASAIGYGLGPRLNAAGRLAHADTSLKLLTTASQEEARQLAAELESLNRERRQLTRSSQALARQLAVAGADGAPLLFAAHAEFPAGIVGLVASRLVDEFYRPAVVVEIGDEISRGSARSIPEFHITHALDECGGLLIRHGGHAAAAGFAVHNDQLPALADRLRALAAGQLDESDLAPALEIDMEAELSLMSWDLQRQLDQLEPCGMGNPQPLFVSRGVRLLAHRRVGNGGRHLKLTLSDGRLVWDGIAFRQGEAADALGPWVDVVYHLEINEWNGSKRLQLNVQDVRSADGAGAAASPGADAPWEDAMREDGV
jgi:single-stranded-DNA-specific exonuclease